MATVSEVAAWAELYRRAWEDMDPAAAASLFAEESSYRDNIFEVPNLGRRGIETYWGNVTAAQSEVTVRMGRPLVQGNQAMVEFWTTMLVGESPLTLAGALILRFDASGLCTDLREYWQTLGELREPPDGWGE